MQPTESDVLDALRNVVDPDLHRDIVSLGFVQNLSIQPGGEVALDIELTTPACPVKKQMQEEAERQIRSVPGVTQVQIRMTAKVPHGRQDPLSFASGVRNFLAVGSGKGGVGKSTVAVNLAVSLARSGARVGLLDADIYGPSIPIMMGCREPVRGGTWAPLEAHGVKLMSIGFLIPPDQPMIWRGPMVHKAVQQFLTEVSWGELDYLLIDLPPGTGDVQLTLVQSVPLTGAVIVCTPQDVALADAVKCLRMFQQVNAHILGIVENMSYYSCPECGHRDDLFGHGGAQQAAGKLSVPFLGEIPLVHDVRASGDEGTPIVARDPEAAASQAFARVASALAAQVATRTALPSQPIRLTVHEG